MKSARFLSIISNKDVFPNPDMLIEFLKKISISTIKEQESKLCLFCLCCECWISMRQNGMNCSCNRLIHANNFNKVYDIDMLIEMKRFLDETY